MLHSTGVKLKNSKPVNLYSGSNNTIFFLNSIPMDTQTRRKVKGKVLLILKAIDTLHECKAIDQKEKNVLVQYFKSIDLNTDANFFLEKKRYLKYIKKL